MIKIASPEIEKSDKAFSLPKRQPLVAITSRIKPEKPLLSPSGADRASEKTDRSALSGCSAQNALSDVLSTCSCTSEVEQSVSQTSPADKTNDKNGHVKETADEHTHARHENQRFDYGTCESEKSAEDTHAHARHENQRFDYGTHESEKSAEGHKDRSSSDNSFINTGSNDLPRILLVTNAMRTGGAETHILALAKGLASLGYFVAIVSSGGAMQCEAERLGIPHIYAPLSSKMPHNIVRSALILKKAARKYRADIIHSHSRLSSLCVKAAFALGLRRKIHFVTTAHLDFRVNALTSALSYWGERTLAVSEDIRGYLIKNYRIPYDKIDVTVNGIDCEHFSFSNREKLPGRKIELLHVSRLDTDRAYTAFLLCDVAASLCRKHPGKIRLTIAGGGDLEKALQNKANRINRMFPGAPVIRLTGEVSDVAPLLQESDIFIGVSRAALEAMSCGIPTLLSGNSGYLGIFTPSMLTEAARTNFCCRGAPVPTVAALERDIEKLLGSDTTELSAELRNTILNHYSLDKMISDYADFYKKVCPRIPEDGKAALVLGYHGFGNAGDDAVLKVIVSLFESFGICSEFTVPAGKALLGLGFGSEVRRIPRYSPAALFKGLRKSDMLIAGGGTLLQSNTSRRSFFYYSCLIKAARLMKKPVIFYSNGMSSYTDREARLLSKLFSKNGAVAVMRDSRSCDIVRSISHECCKIYVCADCGMIADKCDKARLSEILACLRVNGKYAVIAARGEKSGRCSDVAAITGIAILISELGITPIAAVMQSSSDMRVAEAVARLYKKRCSSELRIFKGSCSETAALISRAEFVVTQRMHAAVFAAGSFVPSFIISNDPKCRIFAEEYLDMHCFAPSGAGEETLKSAFSEFYRHRGIIAAELSRKIPSEKELILTTMSCVKEDIKKAGSPKHAKMKSKKLSARVQGQEPAYACADPASHMPPDNVLSDEALLNDTPSAKRRGFMRRRSRK